MLKELHDTHHEVSPMKSLGLDKHVEELYS